MLYDTVYSYVLGFWSGVLLLTTGASAGLDIYKQEGGCDDKTPDLQDNVDLINEKQAELVEMKNNINLRWVPCKNRSVKSVHFPSFLVRIFPHLD